MHTVKTKSKIAIFRDRGKRLLKRGSHEGVMGMKGDPLIWKFRSFSILGKIKMLIKTKKQLL